MVPVLRTITLSGHHSPHHLQDDNVSAGIFVPDAVRSLLPDQRHCGLYAVAPQPVTDRGEHMHADQPVAQSDRNLVEFGHRLHQQAVPESQLEKQGNEKSDYGNRFQAGIYP